MALQFVRKRGRALRAGIRFGVLKRHTVSVMLCEHPQLISLVVFTAIPQKHTKISWRNVCLGLKFLNMKNAN
jgi:hypothetical protein